MRCPYCFHDETSVIDSRDTDEMQITRRRRECLKCKKRFTTYERAEMVELFVIKKDGRREKFDRGKLKGGMLKACEKRPIPLERIEKLTDEIERTLLKREKTEVKSTFIGELVSKKLYRLDPVAYVRFASVYRDFGDINQFKREIQEMLKRRKK